MATTKSNVSGVSADAHNTSTESKKSLSRLGSSFIHRIQSSTHFIGPKNFNVSVQLLDGLETVQGSFKVSFFSNEFCNEFYFNELKWIIMRSITYFHKIFGNLKVLSVLFLKHSFDRSSKDYDFWMIEKFYFKIVF